MTQVESISSDWLQVSRVEKLRLTGNTIFYSNKSTLLDSLIRPNPLDAQTLPGKPDLKTLGRLTGQKCCVNWVCITLLKFTILESSWKIVQNIYTQQNRMKFFESGHPSTYNVHNLGKNVDFNAFNFVKIGLFKP